MIEKVVGHKTRYDGAHEPLYENEAEALWASCKADDLRRREQMPDSMSAIRMLFDARTRLKDEGWSEGIYCPKDGSEFAIIEYGSTGIFHAVYHGEWPSGMLFVGDCCSRPEGVMWKPLDTLSDAEKTQLDKCTESERQMMEREFKAFSDMAALTTPNTKGD